MTAVASEHGVLEWAAGGIPLEGEIESGDTHVVACFPGGALVALIDGLGHGSPAALASRTAARLLETNAEQPLDALLQDCHEALRKTRGVVLNLASFDATTDTMTWAGVGNVEGLLLRMDPGASPNRLSLVTRGGVVGYQLPPLRVLALPVAAGDVVIFATDGIRTGFTEGLAAGRDVNELVSTILENHAKPNDDAHVVVARYLGEEPFEACVPIQRDSDVVDARAAARRLGQREGLTDSAIEALATAVTEVARNILVHADSGEMLFRAVRAQGRCGVLVVARDRGPGIADLDKALQDGYTTGGGLGLGLSGARRLVDELRVSSRIDCGTTVEMKQWAR